jgi:hypothetical protein
LVKIKQLTNNDITKGLNDTNNNNNNNRVSWMKERNSVQQELDAVELEISSHATKLLDLHEELLNLEARERIRVHSSCVIQYSRSKETSTD